MSCGWTRAISSIRSLRVMMTALVRPSRSPRVTSRMGSFYLQDLRRASKERMQNAERRIDNEENSQFSILHSAFCIQSDLSYRWSNDECRETTSERRRAPSRSLAQVGSVSRGPRLGNGARGLQREWRCLVLPAPRAGSLQGVSMGRGRHRRLLRSLSDLLLVHGLLERARSDSEGAFLRPRSKRRQSWRRRQGMLLLPRRATEPCVPADALQ